MKLDLFQGGGPNKKQKGGVTGTKVPMTKPKRPKLNPSTGKKRPKIKR